MIKIKVAKDFCLILNNIRNVSGLSQCLVDSLPRFSSFWGSCVKDWSAVFKKIQNGDRRGLETRVKKADKKVKKKSCCYSTDGYQDGYGSSENGDGAKP